jgi:hypothetical protein
MDLEAARKTLEKPSTFSKKKIAFIGVAGLLLVSGLGWRASHYFAEAPAASEPDPVVAPAPEAAAPPLTETTESVVEKPPVTPAAPVTQDATPAPSEPARQAGDAAGQPDPHANTIVQTEPDQAAAGQAEQADLPGSGMILVARKPVQVLASPSASAAAMYGFPAGRPFRVIGREGGYVQIQDLRSSASGWIEEAALAAPPKQAAPAVSAPSQSKPSAARKPATSAADPKPKPAKKSSPGVAGSEPAASEPAQTRRPPALFGRDGFFGGIFSN